MSDQEFSDRSAESDAPSEAPEQSEPASESPPPPPPTAEGGADSGSDNRGLMLVLSYLWILALIPLLVEKDSEVQWHAKNGLVWTVAEFLMHVVLVFLPYVGCFITPMLMLGWLVVRVMAIMKALKGERMELPYLSDFVEKF